MVSPPRPAGTALSSGQTRGTAITERPHSQGRDSQGRDSQDRRTAAPEERRPAEALTGAPGRAGNQAISGAMTTGAIHAAFGAVGPEGRSSDPIAALHSVAGNQAICRALATGSTHAAVRAGGAVRPVVRDAITATRGRGSSLSSPLASAAGDALGSDLSDVRLHTDHTADVLSRSLGARAFTTGRDVYFQSGHYAPGTSSGRRLLGHELTHAAQHGRSAPPAQGHVAASDSSAERAADGAADTVAARLGGDHRGGASVDAGGSNGGIHRDLGFEFQTGWGLVRSLPATPDPLGPGKDTDRDPKAQSDYPDVPVEHGLEGSSRATQSPTNSVVPTPAPKRSLADRFMGRNKVAESSPTTDKLDPKKSYSDKTTKFSDSAYFQGNKLYARPSVGRRHFKFHKGQIIKDYGDFKLTVDDATTLLGAELEWVVDPPIKASARPEDMGKVMDHLVETAHQLLILKNRESFLLSEVTHDQADDTVELQPAVKGAGLRNMDAAAQATGGVRLDQLIKLFTDLAGDRSSNPTETAKAAKPLLKGYDVAPAMVKAANKVNGSNQLKGLVAFIARYLEMGKYQSPLSYAKVNTQFLARTDFATMFSHLPEEERRKYGGKRYADVGGTAENANDFAQLVLDAVPVNGAGARKIFVGGIKSGNEVKHLDLTVEEWLRGIPEGNDLLSSKYWSQIAQDPQASEQQKGRAGTYKPELESMGNLNKTDKVGKNGLDPGIIMEFRGNTGAQPVDAWRNYAVSIFSYLKELNSRDA